MNSQWPLRTGAAITLLVLLASACASASSSSTPPAVETPSLPPPGSISGRILYGVSDPYLRVYAREVDSGQVYWVEPGEGNFTYTIPDLLPGTYVVVGWFHPMGASGAYTSLDTVVAETVDEQQACEVNIVEIELQSGTVYTGADIGCWGGDFFGLAE